MQLKHDEIEFQQFYVKWGQHVLTFCRLYIGDTDTAETVVAQTFLQYFRFGLPLDLGHLPPDLLSLAIEESRRSGEGGGADVDSDFEWAVLNLPPEERAVFILHGTLGLQLPAVAAITRLAFCDVCQLWMRALLQLRISMVEDDCSRLFAECGTAPNAADGCYA